MGGELCLPCKTVRGIMTFLEQIFLTLFIATLAILGYFAKRHIERRPQIEELEYQERLLRLKQLARKTPNEKNFKDI